MTPLETLAPPQEHAVSPEPTARKRLGELLVERGKLDNACGSSRIAARRSARCS
jgi:hypothetical protein